MTEVSWYGVAAIPLLLGLVQLAKTMFNLPSRWAGGLAVVLGAVFGFVTTHTTEGLITGITVGLAASGLWSTSKASVGK